MRVIDSHSLPAPLLEAIKNDPYSRGSADISVTELIGPPLIRQHIKRLGDDLDVEAVDLLHALDGKAIHSILQLGAGTLDKDDHLVEHRFFYNLDGYVVSGQCDMIYLKQKKLQDYKRTTVGSRRHGIKDEWTRQLNIYKFLAKKSEDIDIDVLEIVCWYKDWSKEKLEHDPTHPEIPIEILNVDVWPLSMTEKYLRERVRVHQTADIATTLDDVEACSDLDRWDRGTGFAIRNKLKDRAMKIVSTRKEALEWMATNVKDRDLGNIVIDPRVGKPMRCQRYCPARFKCSFGKEWAQ